MKRTSTSFVALSLALCLTLGVLVFPAGAAYTDLPASHWAYEDMTKAVAFGIINGKG